MDDKISIINQVALEIQKAHEHFILGCGGTIIINETVHYGISGINNCYLNEVIYFSDLQKETIKNINHIIEQAHYYNVPISFAIMPSNESSDLTAMLIERGFQLKTNLSAMIYYPNKKINFLPNTGVSIKKITEPNDISTLITIMAKEFDYTQDVANEYFKLFSHITSEIPRFELYGGIYNDCLVNSGSLSIFHNFAYISKVATDKNFRNKGLATATMYALLKRAQEFNVDHVILTSLPEAKSIYQKMGFENLFNFNIFVYNP